ncbi:hypothetical protein GCM10010407_17180 [Rarobacter incanus]
MAPGMKMPPSPLIARTAAPRLSRAPPLPAYRAHRRSPPIARTAAPRLSRAPPLPAERVRRFEQGS